MTFVKTRTNLQFMVNAKKFPPNFLRIILLGMRLNVKTILATPPIPKLQDSISLTAGPKHPLDTKGHGLERKFFAGRKNFEFYLGPKIFQLETPFKHLHQQAKIVWPRDGISLKTALLTKSGFRYARGHSNHEGCSWRYW